MGCVYSSVEKEESVRRCRERKRLMKQLMKCRSELAAAHLSYLQSLRNTGATLRQFAEDGSVLSPVVGPPSGIRRQRRRLPLPPSPPPPPSFSPDSRRAEEEEEEQEEQEEEEQQQRVGNAKGKDPTCHEKLSSVVEGDLPSAASDTNDGSSGICTPPPPPSWDFWDPFDPPPVDPSTSPTRLKKGDLVDVEAVEEENWVETNTEFADEEENGGEANLVLSSLIEKSDDDRERLVVGDDNSSMVSAVTKDTDMAVVVWRSRKTLASITKVLDDYFLKASAGGTEVISLLESNRSNCLNFASTGKRSKSAKVFSSLSWRWSSRSPPSSKDACEFQGGSDHCQSGSHCMTLEKLHVEEQKLYKLVKDEEVTKLRYKRKILVLHKQEAREQDSAMLEMTRAKIEELGNRISSLQELINGTCYSISKLRDQELLPQIITLSSRLLKMWRTMYECHQVQNHVAQQANHINNSFNNEPTNDSHRHATAQLEAEVSSWHNAFHKLLKSLREYAHTLNQWVKLTDCLPDSQLCEPSCGIYALCEEWQVATDRLPDKVAAEAIKSFMSVIHSIDLQLMEEHKLQKKAECLEKKLEKEATLLSEVEVRYEHDSATSIPPKQRKLDSLMKRVSEEKSKHMNSIRTSRVMMLNNLQTGLPNVLQAMTGFSGVCVQAFESICQRSQMTASQVNCNSSL